MKITNGVTTFEMMEQIRRVHRYQNVEAMQLKVVQRITALAKESIADQGKFRIVLAGGNTPRAVYSELVKIKTDWNAWHIYFGDERCLPITDIERNDRMAREVWFSQVPIPQDQIHAIPAELGAAAGAHAYAKHLGNIDAFELVLLGLGEDGHTASLFPGDKHEATATVSAVLNAPKPPAERISLSAEMLSKGKHVWFLVCGEGKRDALSRWQNDEAIPASTIRPESGVDIFTEIDG